MLRIVSFCSFLIFLSFAAFAAGPLLVTDGVVLAWDNSSAVSLDPESGSCGGFSNADMVSKLDEVTAIWADLDEVDISFSIDEGNFDEIDDSNYTTVISDADTLNGNNLVTFDEDGDISAQLFGEENRFLVLGFAEVLASDATNITQANFLINCSCLENEPADICFTSCDGGACFDAITEEAVDAVILHEIGHLINLDHSQANETVLEATTEADQDDLPTMYPISYFPTGQRTPTQDDIIALGSIYPSSTLSSNYCLVTGDLVDADDLPLRCADVVAETSSTDDTVSFVSGNNATATDDNTDGDTVDSGECTDDCGHFQLYLTPGTDYTITVRPINSAFTGGSGIGPCSGEQLTTIEEESLSTVSGSQCVAGSVLDLGSLTTTSTGGVSAGSDSETDSGTEEGAGTGAGPQGGGVQRVLGGCALSVGAASMLDLISLRPVLSVFGVGFLLLFFKRRALS